MNTGIKFYIIQERFEMSEKRGTTLYFLHQTYQYG